MSTLNKLKRVFTREGAPAKAFGPADELKRTLMNCLLWEDQFYEDGVSIADRIKHLVPLVEPERVAALAIAAREDMRLRHAPLLVLREMARHATHRGLVADTLVRVIQRPDEMTELLAIYWADALGPLQQRKRQPISGAIEAMRVDRILPYRFITAARYAPDFEPELESAMLKSIKDHAPLKGRTRLLIDVSGSMDTALSRQSEMTRLEAGGGLGIFAREVCEACEIFTF